MLPPGDTRDNDGIGTLFESEGETERERSEWLSSFRFVSFRFRFSRVVSESWREIESPDTSRLIFHRARYSFTSRPEAQTFLASDTEVAAI